MSARAAPLVALVLVAAALLGLAPAAQAHECYEGPACGPCPPGEHHHHLYPDDHRPYCESDDTVYPPPPPPPEPKPCFISVKGKCIVRDAVHVNLIGTDEAAFLA